MSLGLACTAEDGPVLGEAAQLHGWALAKEAKGSPTVSHHVTPSDSWRFLDLLGVPKIMEIVFMRPPAIGGGSQVLLAAGGPGSLVWGVNRSGERGREGVEFGLEAGVVGAGSAALHEVPDRVSSQFPGLLDFWGLGGLDGSGGKAVLAGGDLDPGVNGGDLAFPVTELWSLRAGDGWEPGDQVLPGVFVDGPGFQRSASLLVVGQRCGGLIEFGGEGLECCFEGERIGLLSGVAVDVTCAGVDSAFA
jgi:hypothetical protein